MTGARVNRWSVVRAAFVFAAVAAPLVSRAADWPRFRGPNGSGIAEANPLPPLEWRPTRNIAWKVELPGAGSSSPIVVKDRVYVTCYSGYGLDRQDPGRMEDLRRHLLAIDRKTGQVIWTRTVEPYLPEDPYRGNFTEHGYASHTPVSDGENVYCFFGKTGVVAFDWDGNVLWKTQVGTESNPQGWGTASSPVLYKDLVIVTASAESQAIIALDKRTGQERWRAEASGLIGVWGTPVLVPVSEERTDLVIMVPNEIWGLNPDTGKLRWYSTATRTNTVCSSLVVVGDTVIGIESMGGGSVAVRAGGEGDVSATHLVWSGRDNNRISTPVAVNGRVYFFSNRVANCIDARTGERIFQARLEGGRTASARTGQPSPPGGRGGRFGGRGMGGFGGSDYGSPIAAGDRIYFTTRNGDTFVIRASDKFEQLAVNRVTDEPEDFSATPAISDGQIFIRSDRHLYCVAETVHQTSR
ncbi:MAG: serine/threonine protein kinase [Pirellulaceae bacterium]|nr:MAG: serine/threonine protein kinase [Pirellulaceae bacterium]